MGYANQQLADIPFRHIIGSPLIAAIEAQGAAAKATLDFIRTVGFKPVDDNDPLFAGDDDATDSEEIPSNISAYPDFGETRYVTFTYYVTTGEDGEGKAILTLQTLTVPLLTIVPIPFLRIDDMSIDFTAKISQFYEKTKSETSTSTKAVDGKSGWFSTYMGISGSVTSSANGTTNSDYKTSTEYTMNVQLRATQETMPAGLAKILSILESATLSAVPDSTTKA